MDPSIGRPLAQLRYKRVICAQYYVKYMRVYIRISIMSDGSYNVKCVVRKTHSLLGRNILFHHVCQEDPIFSRGIV